MKTVDKMSAPEEGTKVKLFSLHSCRFRVGLMLMFAFFCSNSMRTDLSMAMVCMVNSTFHSSNLTSLAKTKDYHGPCKQTDESLANAGYKGHLEWTPEMQSLLFSATYYGSFITVLPGGMLADRFSPKKILILAIGNYVFVSLLTPTLANWNFYVFFFARIVMGLGEGFIFPTLTSFAARWFPPAERGRMMAIYTAGNQVATAVVSTVGAQLCSLNFLGGWPLIFYLFAFLGVVWITLSTLFVTSAPQNNPWVSEKEKNFIHEHNAPGKKLADSPLPWRSVTTSPVVYANLLSMSALSFTATLLLSFLPTYNRDVLMLDIHANGMYTTITFVVTLTTKIMFGILSDKIKKSGFLSATATCKWFQVSGATTQALCLLGLAFFGKCTMPTLALVFLIFQGLGAALVVPGAMTSILCIAPNHTGTMSSLSMIASQVANIMAPNIVGFIRKKGTPEEWTLILTIGAVFNCASAITFLIFGSADRQDWGRTNKVANVSVVFQSTDEKNEAIRAKEPPAAGKDLSVPELD